MIAVLHIGDAPIGLPFMKFTLTYDGELRANGKPKHKWEMRKHFHPQLAELWKISPALRYVSSNKWVARKGPFGKPVIHHSAEVENPNDLPPSTDGDWLDICAPIAVGNRTFVPLVRDTLALQCGLKILFLRKEEPGNLIYQGGDVDNRMKTLLDALSMPNADQLINDPAADEPLYCLLENDRMISGCSIETQRLLSRPNASKHDVRLIIEVDVRVTQARAYNQSFLGD
jgi:hypothetical protein